MNIFKVFQTGGHRIYETGFSAFLGYLLDTNADHGLSDTFLKEFIKLTGVQASEIPESISSEIQRELMLTSKKRLDIELKVYDKEDRSKEIFNFIIENKIQNGAAQSEQLSNYYEEYKKENSEAIPLTVVFLTPDTESINIQDEFANLNVKESSGDTKVHLFWSGNNSISNLLHDILLKESVGDLSPLNEQVKHTIRAFRNFIKEELVATISTRERKEIGNSIQEQKLVFNSGEEFTLVRRDSGQIQVYDNTGSPVVAKTVIQSYIRENNLKIQSDKQINTRTMGKNLIDSLSVKKAG